MARGDVYTFSLGYRGNLPSAEYLFFTAGQAFVTILRDIVVANNAGAEHVINVYMRSGTETIYLLSASVGTNRSEHLELRQVIDPNVGVWAYSTSSSWSAAFTGYMLEAPAARAEQLPGPELNKP